MGVAAENSSTIWQLNMLKNSTEGEKTGKSCGAAAEIAKKTLLDMKKSSDHTFSSNKLCICAPTSHPGSFRCRLHRATARSSPIKKTKTKTTQTPGLSRFAKDVSQESNDSLHKPQYNSE